MKTVSNLTQSAKNYVKQLNDQEESLNNLSDMTLVLDSSIKKKIPKNIIEKETLENKVNASKASTMDWFLTSYMTPSIKKEYDQLITTLVDLDQSSAAHIDDTEHHFMKSSIPTQMKAKETLSNDIAGIQARIDSQKSSLDTVSSDLSDKYAQIESESNAWSMSNTILLDEKEKVLSEIASLSNNTEAQILVELSDKKNEIQQSIRSASSELTKINNKNAELDTEKRLIEESLEQKTCS